MSACVEQFIRHKLRNYMTQNGVRFYKNSYDSKIRNACKSGNLDDQ